MVCGVFLHHAAILRKRVAKPQKRFTDALLNRISCVRATKCGDSSARAILPPWGKRPFGAGQLRIFYRLARVRRLRSNSAMSSSYIWPSSGSRVFPAAPMEQAVKFRSRKDSARTSFSILPKSFQTPTPFHAWPVSDPRSPVAFVGSLLFVSRKRATAG